MSKLTPLHRRNRQPMEVHVDDPEGMAECDGCGFWVNHKFLEEQFAYRGGSTPVGTGLFKCGECLDALLPQPGYMKIVLPPDPVPLRNPRPPNESLNPDPMLFLVASVGGDYLIADVANVDFLMAENPGI